MDSAWIASGLCADCMWMVAMEQEPQGQVNCRVFGLPEALDNFGKIIMRVACVWNVATGERSCLQLPLATIATRRGGGTTRHIGVSQPWVQDKVSSGGINRNIRSAKETLAGTLTKYEDSEPLDKHLGTIVHNRVSGRHNMACKAMWKC